MTTDEKIEFNMQLLKTLGWEMTGNTHEHRNFYHEDAEQEITISEGDISDTSRIVWFLIRRASIQAESYGEYKVKRDIKKLLDINS